MIFRHLSCARIIVALVLIVAGLQILHIFMLSRLEQKHAKDLQASYFTRHDDTKVQTTAIDFYTEYKELWNLVQKNKILDTSGQYHLIYKISDTKIINQDDVVTLVTQSSVNNLYHLLGLGKHWTGPISVTIFAPAHDMAVAIEAIIMLGHCVPSTQNITFHLAYPLSHPPDGLSMSVRMKHLRSANCDHVEIFLSEVASKSVDKNYERTIMYPSNLLRNTAIKNANTEFIFVIDIDMVPSFNLHEQFKEFAKKNRKKLAGFSALEKTVFVVPAFEIRHNYNVPKTKYDLLDMVDEQRARQFYVEPCKKCQSPTAYATWVELDDGVHDLRIGYEVDWVDPYEPFFIAEKSIPQYDQRFKQFGFNRISQVCELQVAGYRFAVFNLAFLVHRGYKLKKDFHKTKDKENAKNRLLYRKFKTELRTKYSSTTRHC